MSLRQTKLALYAELLRQQSPQWKPSDVRQRGVCGGTFLQVPPANAYGERGWVQRVKERRDGECAGRWPLQAPSSMALPPLQAVRQPRAKEHATRLRLPNSYLQAAARIPTLRCTPATTPPYNLTLPYGLDPAWTTCWPRARQPPVPAPVPAIAIATATAVAPMTSPPVSPSPRLAARTQALAPPAALAAPVQVRAAATRPSTRSWCWRVRRRCGRCWTTGRRRPRRRAGAPTCGCHPPTLRCWVRGVCVCVGGGAFMIV